MDFTTLLETNGMVKCSVPLCPLPNYRGTYCFLHYQEYSRLETITSSSLWDFGFEGEKKDGFLLKFANLSLAKIGLAYPKKRYFKVISKILEYYTVVSSGHGGEIKKRKKAGRILLHKSLVQNIHIPNYKFAFTITPHKSERQYVLIAESAWEKEEWIKVFRLFRHAPAKLNPCSIREGWMKKLGSMKKNWKKRYFVLTDDGLSYYAKIPNKEEEEEQKSKGKLMKQIPLTEDSIVSMEAGNNAGEYEIGFTSLPGKRRFMFRCTNEYDAKIWVKSIQQCIDYKTRRPSYTSQNITDQEIKKEEKRTKNQIPGASSPKGHVLDAFSFDDGDGLEDYSDDDEASSRYGEEITDQLTESRAADVFRKSISVVSGIQYGVPLAQSPSLRSIPTKERTNNVRSQKKGFLLSAVEDEDILLTSNAWKKLWVCLQPSGVLEFYLIKKTKQDTFCAGVGYLETSDAKIEECDPEEMQVEHAFRVTPAQPPDLPFRPTLLAAANVHEKNEWIKAIESRSKLTTQVNPNSHMEGYIKKLSEHRKIWKTRYFILLPRTDTGTAALLYYDKISDKKTIGPNILTNINQTTQ